MRVTTMQNIFDLIREDEEKAIAQTRKEIAEEKAAWDALTQEERDAINKAREDKYPDIPDEPDLDSEDYEDDED